MDEEGARTGVLPAAPRAGEYTREILREFGFGAGNIGAMERSGIVSHLKAIAE